MQKLSTLEAELSQLLLRAGADDWCERQVSDAEPK